jgi:hypothetical protein
MKRLDLHGDVVALFRPTGVSRGHSRKAGEASPRMHPLEYPGHFLVKKVTTGGTFRFQHKLLYIANSLVDQHIGLEETDDGAWSIYFNTVLIATLNERDYIIRG